MPQILETVKAAVATVWSVLGSGHSEAVYQAALKVELLFSIDVNHLSSGRVVPIFYKGHSVGSCVLDLDFCDGTDTMCILELKAIKTLRDEDRGQLQRYRRLFSSQTTGILINFGSPSPEVEQVS